MREPTVAARYARLILKERWPEAEPVIASQPNAAADYAISILQKRWPDTEVIITKNAIAATAYAVKFFENGWPEAEPAIAKHAQSAVNYVRYCRKSEWPAAEPAILAHEDSILSYIRFKQGAWPEAEKVIARYPVSAIQYAEFNLRERWTPAEQALLDFCKFEIEKPGASKSYFKNPFNRASEAEKWIAMHGSAALWYAELLGGRFKAGEETLLFSGYLREEYLNLISKGADRDDDSLNLHSAAIEALEESEDEESANASRDVMGLLSSGSTEVHDQRLAETFSELDEMIGLEGVKRELKKIAAFAKVQQIRLKRHGGELEGNSLHLIFTGNPGTGKTTVARLIGKIYSAAGLLPEGHLTEVGRGDLVGAYLGQSEERTLKAIEQADGGIMFIDEAYALARDYTGADYGQEVIDVLVAEMENRRGSMAVIAAGYPGKMEKFLSSNPGLDSRFSRTVHFEDYSADEMLQIFKKMASDRNYQVSLEAEAILTDAFALAKDQAGEGFGNGRFVRNSLERVVENHGQRLANFSETDDVDFDLIEVIDVPEYF